MREPWFWRERGLTARAAALALTPAALLYDIGQRIRTAATAPAAVGAPVICVGNASLGGVGKTPFALMLLEMLSARGIKVFFQSRGYGGSLAGPLRVVDEHDAEAVGDEPLLLAAAAPTFVARDRLAGVRAAAKAGADIVIMDDGLQNPRVAKDFSFLLIGEDMGNGRLFPAGPMREPLARAAARADAIVLVGMAAAPFGVPARPTWRATARISPEIAPQKILAFCGIGRPARFFAALEKEGFTLAERVAFPDHYPFTLQDVGALRSKAAKLGVALMTTEKDFVRIAPEERNGVAIARLAMSVDDPDALLRLVLEKIGRAP
jgi:tetraacyldisaccharide 4'-kinase